VLDEFGCKLVGPATNAPRALELIGKESIEIAVLDLNLEVRTAIADALQKKNVPFIFATRYDSTGIRKEWPPLRMVRKGMPRPRVCVVGADQLAGYRMAACGNTDVRSAFD
jgi:hypothetical protein